MTDNNNMTPTPSIQWSDIPNDIQELNEVQSDNFLMIDSPETCLYSASTASPNTLQIIWELDRKIDKFHRELTSANWSLPRNNYFQRHTVFKTQPNSRRPQTRTCFRCRNRGHLQKWFSYQSISDGKANTISLQVPLKCLPAILKLQTWQQWQ